LSQWLGLRPGHLPTWSIKTFLSFLVVVLPPYLLALHYHYSSEGILLSSALAGSFGAFLSWQMLHKRTNPSNLTVSFGLLVLGCCVYLLMPVLLNLLYALVVISSFALYMTQPNSEKMVQGGRSELFLTLNPFSASEIAPALQRTLLLWAFFSVLAHALHKLIHTQWVALIPFVAIAVSCSAVQNLRADKEHQ
jgi:uncharacterized membrane protein YsdA (DUF1294 family)